MARIKKRTLTLTHPGTDLAAMRVYYKPDTGEVIGYSDPFIEFPGAANPREIVMPDEIPVADGVWRLGFTALDEAGNESDIVATGPVPFDFTPPPPVSDWSIT